MEKKVTLASLARLANVDVSTVSRALNHSPLVKKATREQILKLADETGYVGNASARSLRRQSSETLGIVIPMRPESGQTISDPFYLQMVGAVSQAASAAGYDLIISVPEKEGQIAERRLLQTGRADGLIIIGQAGISDRLNSLGTLTNKVVVWGGHSAGSTYTLVGSDNAKGGRLVAEHLVKAKRKSVLFVGDTELPEVALRYQGLREGLLEAGIDHSADLILKQNFGGQSAVDRIIRFANDGPAFDAVFAASDVLAIAAMHALAAVGRKVPGDVSVVGYDNIDQAALTLPALTTISQNIKQGGELLVELLLRKIAGERVRSRVTTTELVVRDSSI